MVITILIKVILSPLYEIQIRSGRETMCGSGLGLVGALAMRGPNVCKQLFHIGDAKFPGLQR
ncbi:MAG: hypothetical protein WAM30_17400 [Candidatus Dormiibacterota bacterium]